MDFPTSDTRQRHAITRVRHENGVRLLDVAGVESLSRRMRRITLRGQALRGFTSLAADDHCRVFFPAAGQRVPVLPGDPAGRKPLHRDYTPGRFDESALELQLDLVLHGEGPASVWARQAAVGQQLGIGGPRGSHIVATDFDWYLLMGDETALPAISRRLAELPSGARALVRLEVDDEGDALPLATAATLDLQWLVRGAVPAGESRLLLQALHSLSLPAGDGYAWLACESGIARMLRQRLLEVHELPRQWVKASGYWKLGSTDVHDKLSD